jgi:EAL domain-containing protein (putative c-di-GMP-specific phosphodiesterase class I)
MNIARRPQGREDPEEPFIPDFSEGMETGLYLALFELLDEGLIITGDEVVLEANSAACRLLERDYRQIAGKPLSDLFPSGRAFLEARARLFIQGEMRGSLQVSLPGDRHRTLRFTAAARVRPGIHALILSPDLIAEAYAESPSCAPQGDELWPRLAAALHQPVIVVDDRERVAAANTAALDVLGMTREDLIGHPAASRIRIEWPAAGAAPVARLTPKHAARSLQARILAGPKPGWRLLLLPPSGRHTTVATPTVQGSAAAIRHGQTESPASPATGRASDQSLRQAVDRHQLEVHFQPLVDARNGSVRGGEALLRWRHPDLGLIPFRRFMAIARDAGLLTRMGDWILHAACAHAAGWSNTTGRAFRVTVNVAIEQIVPGDLAGRVRHALGESGLPAAMLELDLEETVLHHEDARLASTLGTLHDMGVKLAIDDFGRGLASIPRLKRYPLDALKLDPVLVREVGVREESEAVVEAIASMAGVLGLEVLARGVEGEAQQAFLTALGCHLQQGPLFGQTMSADAFRDYLRRPGPATGQ